MSLKHRQEAINVLKGRYSCRDFSDKEIDADVLNEILQVGVAAASGGNLQPVSVIKIRDKDKKKRIRELCKQGFIEKADTLLLFVLDYQRIKRWADVEVAPFGRQNSFVDFIIALEDVMCMAQSIECAATLLGVGSVYIGTVNYVYEELKDLLDLPELTIPVLMTCLGIPKTDDSEAHLQGHLSKKLGRDIIIHEEKYKQLSDEEVKEKIVSEKYDDWRLDLEGEVLDKYLKELYEVAKEINGEEWAIEVSESILKSKGINRAQFRLGHHYNPVRLRSYNSKLIEFYKKQGFNFWTVDND
jgi:FMN reductase [NAD(P)H]